MRIEGTSLGEIVLSYLVTDLNTIYTMRSSLLLSKLLMVELNLTYLIKYTRGSLSLEIKSLSALLIFSTKSRKNW